jgi:DNA-binding FadR family transcriptional regulator
MTADLLSTLTRRILFAPLADVGRVDLIADRLRTAIALGVLADGEQLPSEGDLAAQFNISPVTLREALSQLRAQGLVHTRRGRGGGSVITSPEGYQVSTALEQVRSLSTLDLRDLADWRRALVSQSARLAARRASQENIEALRRRSARLAAAGDEVEARREDSRFFIEVAASAQSVRLSKGMIELQVEYAPVLTLVYRDDEIRTLVATHLAEVAASIAAGAHADAARFAVSAVDLVATAASAQSVAWRNDDFISV